MHPYVLALLGGGLIGLAAGVFLIANGRIAGISGILGGLLTRRPDGASWRVAFIAGLVAGGLVVSTLYPPTFPSAIDASYAYLAIAGLLVGFGTRLGSGCTSGHGVCGVTRLSPRSLVATSMFMLTGALTVFLVRAL